ncbi:DUF4148 domain-containing protein [Paracidovorax valerianellae]|uniref:DUF4148 domain-containing protein n=1 Tax=Paracidovorax valerianellae TaxID=187868 RepID=A0A1G6WUK5_9BURK|nr:DUF4148 domain-containing protein [Paracidovorax valerianellae]MDA8447634.1 DUF4148 domain-containing protein [Paracidovorax valerianellae]SDD68705.1 hypothetical protein SAMN05192589_10890 [Paracidovorax valerianellae]
MPTLFTRSGLTPFRTAVALYALCSLAAASAAMAQIQPSPEAGAHVTAAAAAPLQMAVAADATPVRTRAEVVAELLCARASGEMESMSMQSHGLPSAPVNRAVPECKPQARTSVAGGAAAGAAP